MTVAVVTGAGGSLGRATARRLAAGGHLVAVTDVDGPGLDELAAVVSFLAVRMPRTRPARQSKSTVNG